MTENPPIMVLSEETLDRVTFRFRGQRWAVATVIPGVILIAIVIVFSIRGNTAALLLLSVGLLGLILLYSSVYSLTANQWLTADGRTRMLKFHKENIYGLVDWERRAAEFTEIRVWKSLRSTSWAITIICGDGYCLHRSGKTRSELLSTPGPLRSPIW
jgi:hypothetical protein